MKSYHNLLKKTSLFAGLSSQEIEYIEKALNLSVTSFAKGSVIFSQGDTVEMAGLLLEGTITAESVSYSGERRLIQTHTKGSVFADVLMSSVNHPTPVSVIAKEDSKVVFIDFAKLTESSCNPICRKVLANMLHGIADKFWLLNRKIAYISCKSLRSRIAMFLLDTQKELNQSTFSVPYNREELASLLGANRSALSRELSRMQEDKIISFYKNSFKIENLQKLKNCL